MTSIKYLSKNDSRTRNKDGDKSIWEGQISVRVADVTEVLLSLTTVKNVMVSMNEDSCHWTGEVPAGRVRARTIKWV